MEELVPMHGIESTLFNFTNINIQHQLRTSTMNIQLNYLSRSVQTL